TNRPAPFPAPHSSARRRVKPPTMRAPGSWPSDSGIRGSTAPERIRARTSRTSYPGDGVQTAASSTAPSSSAMVTVGVKASPWVLSTHPSIARSYRSRPTRNGEAITGRIPPPSLERVLLGIGVELGLAGHGAEINGLPLVARLAGGRLRVDIHVTDRI